MSQVSATRSELLARRAQIALAEQGRDLLQEKRAALMREFQRLSSAALEGLDALERCAAVARTRIAAAVAHDGAEQVTSASMAARRDIRVAVSSRDVAGVRVVELEADPVMRRRTGRGYALAATSARIDDAAEAFETVLDRLLVTAARERNLRRLAEEIAKTTRRVNALEEVTLPRLERERDAIAMALDERELEDRVRLRRAKSRPRTAPAT